MSLLLKLCVCAALSTGLLLSHAQAARLADANQMKTAEPLPAGVVCEATAGGMMRLQVNAEADTAQVRHVRLALPEPVALSPDSLRAGLRFFAVKPLSQLQGWWLTFNDARGRAFEYKLPAMESFQTGWQYFDTFPFTANEMGRLHPDVGRLVGQGATLPEMPMSLTGLRLELKGAAQGELLLSELE